MNTRHSRRVLVIDDYADAAETTAMMLRVMGHQVETATDGPTGLKVAETFAPQVVLLDIGLPEMDGYEVARRLRQTPQGREALLIAVTGYGQDQDRQRAADAGFDLHQLKPIQPEKLSEVLEGPLKADLH